jgi:hypothetical protein
MSEQRTSEWLQSFTGRQLFPFECRPEDICLEDIAHSLSLQCRFVGHCKFSYSVAQHSLYVSDHCPPELQAWGLLHDAAEVWIGDISRPLKRCLVVWSDQGPDWGIKEVEENILACVAMRFNLPSLTDDQQKKIKYVDNLVLATEKRDVMCPTDHEWEPLPKPLDRHIEEVNWKLVKGIFIDRARELGVK